MCFHSIVCYPSITGMVEYFCGASALKIMSRHTLNSKIDCLFEAMKNQLIVRFSNVEHIGLTADIWSSKHRSFMGMTAHWIDPVTFKRQIATISCNRFTFPHTNERIAENLQIVCDIFGIGNKITATTTDNAANFSKAYREFGLAFEDDFYDDDESDMDGEIEYVEVNTSLSSQVRCGSHTFNLIGVKDAAAAQNDKKYFAQHKSAFTKLNRLWKCCKQPKAAEKIIEILGVMIHRPVATRWNGLFDCVVTVLRIDMEILNKLMRELSIPEFTQSDIRFLHEYVTVLKPIAKAIDALQADCHFAYLLPVVYNTVNSLRKMNESLTFCQPLQVAVLNGVEERFGYCYNFDDDRCKPALVATCTHPYFKTRWFTGPLRTPENLMKIRDILISAAAAVKPLTQTNKQGAVSLPGRYIHSMRLNENPTNCQIHISFFSDRFIETNQKTKKRFSI